LTIQKITFRTKDGVNIVGNYFKPKKEHAPVFLLLHMMPSTKESWNTFATLLQEKGYAVLAIDLRGHGESIDKNGKKIDYKAFEDEDHRESMNDIAAAKEFLARQKEIDTSRIAMAGASIGANLALWQASIDKNVGLLILLSVGLDYRGIKTPALAHMYSGHVYIMASEGDSYAAESSREIFNEFHREKMLKIIKGKSHGTDMMASENEVIDELVGWIIEKFG